MAFDNPPPIRSDIVPGGTLTLPWVKWFLSLISETRSFVARQIDTTGSISGGGDLSADRTLRLKNDVDNPPPSSYYGTNASGTVGWWPLP